MQLGRFVGGSVAVLALAVLTVGAMAISAAPSPAMASQEQAVSGAGVYTTWCAICHGLAAEGGEGPALDRRTLASYRTGDRLFRFIAISMPSDLPGVLSEQEYLDVTAFLLELNGMNPGGVPVDPSTLADIPLN
jgi:mono/diheme cytochrome c family protein